MDLFNLAAKITLDTTEYERGLTGAQSKWNSMGSFIKGGAGKIAKVGGVALAAASGAVVAFGKKSIDAGMAFDSSMSQVAATMGLTMAELQSDVKTTDTAFGTFTGNLREYAQFMGKNTAFSATEAADALNYMALAGYDTQTSMDMLPNVLNLAAAGNMDLARASDMVTDAQTALGLDIGETTELVDKMAKTSSKSNTSVSQLGEAMLTVGGTAKNMKGGTTELSAALGILADNGIKGAEGGTALRNVLLGIQSKKFEKTFGELGVSAYDADGNLRPLNETLADMNDAMEGMTEQEKTKLITNTFNKADLKSVNALLGTSAERWDELTGEIENASGAAQDMADTQLDNLAGDVTLFKSALEGAQIAISDSLNPTLRNLVQEGTSGLQRLTDAFTEGGFDAAIDVAADLIAEWTAKLVEGIPKLIGIGAKLLLALARGIITALPSVVKGLVTLGGQLVDSIRRGMAKGVGLLANGFGKSLKQKSNSFRKSAMTIIGTVGDQASRFLELGKMFIENLMDGLTEAFPTLMKNGTEIIKKIHTGIINAIPTLIGIGGKIIEFILSAIPEMAKSGEEIIKNLINGIKLNAPQITKEFGSIFTNIATTVSDWLPTIVTKGGEILKSLSSGIASALPQIATAIGGVLTSIGGWITSNASSFASKGGEIWDAIVSGISTAIDTIGETLAGIGGKILEWINGDGLSSLNENGTAIWEKIKEGFTNALADIGQLVAKIIVGIGTWITTNYDQIAQAGKNILSYIVEGVVNVASDIATGMLSLIGAAATWVVNNRGQILNVGISILGAIISGIKSVITTIGNGFVDLVSNIAQWVTDHSDEILAVGTSILDWIISGIADFIGNVVDGFANFMSTLWSWIQGIGTAIQNIGKTVVERIKDGIKDKISSIKDAFTGMLGAIREKITSMAEGLKGIGGKIVDGIKAGITGVKDIAEKIGGVINKAIDSATSKTYNANVKIAAQTGYKKGSEDPGLKQAKARYKPYLFNKSTIFGRYQGHDLIAGEAGPEMLLGVNKLNAMLFQSVQGGMQSMMGQIYNMMSGMQTGGGGNSLLEAQILDVLNQYLPGIAERQIVLDTGALAGAVAPGVNEALGTQVGNRRRYNA